MLGGRLPRRGHSVWPSGNSGEPRQYVVEVSSLDSSPDSGHATLQPAWKSLPALAEASASPRRSASEFYIFSSTVYLRFEESLSPSLARSLSVSLSLSHSLSLSLSLFLVLFSKFSIAPFSSALLRAMWQWHFRQTIRTNMTLPVATKLQNRRKQCRVVFEKQKVRGRHLTRTSQVLCQQIG